MRRFGLIGFPAHPFFFKKVFYPKFTENGIDAIYETYPIKGCVGTGILIKNNTELKA
jgi:hypothetical protein